MANYCRAVTKSLRGTERVIGGEMVGKNGWDEMVRQNGWNEMVWKEWLE